MESKTKYSSNDEIDLLEIFKTIWEGRRTVVKFLIVFTVIGLFIAVFSAKEYTATTIVVPQTSNTKLGADLGGLAAIAGINLGGRDSERISPSLYPIVVQSILFKKELLEVPLKFSNLEKEITYKEYYTDYQKFNLLVAIKEYTIGLPGKMISLFKGKEIAQLQTAEVKDSIYVMSKEDKKLFDLLQSQLVIDVNGKEGFVQMSFSMPEALPAAQMTKKVQELLQNAITKFKIQKSQEQYMFIEERYNEAKKDFIGRQSVLANFRDKNQGLILSRSQSHLERLQSDYNLAYEVYSELAKQLEAQKIKLKENTPIFTVIEPVSVPIEKSKPRRGMILVIWFLLGVIFGVGWVFAKKIISNLRMNNN
ncbi:capsule biosynthesis protein [Tenacibaculum discolor]|uniref:Capsule biosynthesis protein n=1 Tax=Tenacibaculum discolor TaxID=361581 RepID=A0A2G1BXQ0_9FLAO|nr:Wzz/FepE/Etk N-terminal domain-containing protein [Tenacibaculum discolor]MDP2541097.1 Wzz/FepE/Etk N-terminal domain-containing protein [Tenacibaculum discolor]PHN98810.1 capsule biosynthesis protein [Tenacibaculum discolor]PHO01632.1 capsule biosynthesis protein [Rhodobacteraceae bacterium 4F10]